MLPISLTRMRVITEYLRAEVIDKQFPSANISGEFRLPVNWYAPKVPQQTNGTDCGLFLLEYVQNFLENPGFILDDLN